MKPQLFLLTHGYPFGRSEAFLESECPIVAKAFDITFVPAELSGEQRQIPPNANIDTGLAERFRSPSRKRRSLFSRKTWAALLDDLPNHRCRVAGMRRVNSFVSDALETADWARKTLKGYNPLVYTYWMTGKTHGLVYARDSLPDLKIVTRAHRFDLYDDRYDPAFWPLRQKTINEVDRLFVISDDGKRYLDSRYRIHAGVMVSRLGAIDPRIRSSRSDDGVVRIVSCSSFLPQKRVELIARLICDFARTTPSQKLHWQHFGDGPLRANVLEFLDSNCPENLETCFPGSVSNQSVLSHYRNQPVDVFVNLSDSEGIPVSIMEAQACGILVIATDVGGVAEIVNETNGFLLEARVERNRFENTMLRVCNSDGLPTSDSIFESFQGRYNAEKNYSSFTQDLLNLMEEVK